MNLDELERLDAAYIRICRAGDNEAKFEAWDHLVSALYGNLPDFLALARDGERYRLMKELWPLELERLLRAHLGVAGGTVETLCDAAMKERT